jgi:cytochrome c oxidase subunit 2
MNFYAMVTSRSEFDRWLSAQAADATPAQESASVRGEQIFLSYGCPACHTVRGTPARGAIGPDLTHVGSRLSLGAARLANRSADFENWLLHVGELKPGALMPEYRMLSAGQIRDLSSYLEALQ